MFAVLLKSDKMVSHIKFGGYDPIENVLASGGGIRWLKTVN